MSRGLARADRIPRASCATGHFPASDRAGRAVGPGSYAFVDGFGDGRVWIDVAGNPTTELLDWAECGRASWARGSSPAAGRRRSRFSRAREPRIRTRPHVVPHGDRPRPIPRNPSGPTESSRAHSRPETSRLVYEVHQETFTDTWEPIEETFEEWAHQFLVPEVLAPALWTLAVAGDEPAGFAICHPHAVDSGLGWVRVLGVRGRVARTRTRSRAAAARVRAVPPSRSDARRARGRCGEPDRSEQALRVGRDARRRTVRDLREGRGVSALRARCPNCRTFTAVAIGDGYECHSCGSTFAAGLVRVPAAWGSGGEAMAEGARIALPYPEVAVVERDTLDEQTAAIAEALSARPIVLGGCCCAHVGARAGRLATSRSPRRRLDRRSRRPEHARDVAVRESLGDAVPDDPRRRRRRGRGRRTRRRAKSRSARGRVHGRDGIDDSLDRALAGVDAAYVALDLDVLDPSEVDVLIPEPDGPSADEIEALLRELAGETTIAGIGVTGFLATERNAALARGCSPRLASETPALVSSACLPGKVASTSRSRASARTSRSRARRIPNTCPGCGSHYRDDELEQTLRVCPQCGHHFRGRRARSDRAARRSGVVRRGGCGAALGRSTRVLRPAPVHGAARRSRDRDGARRRDRLRSADDRG